jgi:hypothetical protein
MPNYLKPLTTASSAQMRAMLERIISKRKPVAKVPEPSPAMPGAPPPTMEKSAAERILGSGLPFKENEYGRLIDNAIPDKPVPQTLPIQEAMNTYMTNPERYSPAPMGNPVKHVYPGGVGSDSGSLGASIAAERMVFKNPVPPGIRANQASVQRELTGQNINRGKVGEFEAMVKQKAEGNPKYAMPIGEQLALAARLEDMWRAMDGGSGGRSGAAKLWKAYLDSSNGRDKVRTGKDYFIACALRDQKDPKMMARHYPREKRLLDQMKKSYKEVTGTDLDSGVPAFPEE